MAGDEQWGRFEDAFRRNTEAIDASRRAFEDLRRFLRELTVRHERAFGAMIQQLSKQTDELREQRVELREQRREWTQQMEVQRRQWTKQIEEQRREFVEESRAQRAALFRILDRLDGGGAEAGA